jgi:hypothetical protein
VVLTDQSSLSAAKLTGSLPSGMGGKVLQVVSTIKTDTQSSSVSGDYPISGLSATITPSNTSSRIFILYSINYDSIRGNSGGGFRIYRNGSHLLGASGQAAGSRYFVNSDFGANANADQSGMHRTGHFLDYPNTTSALTYQIYIYQDLNSFITYINRARSDTDQSDDGRYASTITLMEIAP